MKHIKQNPIIALSRPDKKQVNQDMNVFENVVIHGNSW